MTPTTPRKFTATPVTAGLSSPTPAKEKSGAAAAPAAGSGGQAASGTIGTVKQKRPWLMIGLVALLVVVAVGGVMIWKWMNPGPPLLTAPTLTLANFVLDPEFSKQSVDKQGVYLEVMDQRYDDGECEKLWRAGKLTEMQMAELRDGAWMGKHMGRMFKYYSLPPGTQRKEYIARQVGKKFEDDEESEEPQPVKAQSAEEEKPKVPKREKSWGKKLVSTWPSDVQAQWKEYHKEIKKEEDRRKDEEKKGEATKPVA